MREFLRPQGFLGVCRRCGELFDECECEEGARRLKKLKQQQAKKKNPRRQRGL